VAAALRCATRATSLRSGLVGAVQLGGDTDTVAALVGGLMGGNLAAGHTNKSAAKTLGVSVNTVGTQLRSIFAKLGIQSRVQLANSLHENSASHPV